MNNSANAAHRYRIGFDIGGTFTDFILADRKGDAMSARSLLGERLEKLDS